jgi:small Trp-rich protein
MWFLMGGVVLLVLWLGDIGPFGNLSWYWVALPFLAAVLWWWFADNTGYTQRVAARKDEERKLARRERDMEALGLNARRRKKVRVMRDRQRLQADTDASKAPPAPPAPPAPKTQAEAEPRRRDPRL